MVVVGLEESPNARADVLEPTVVESLRERLQNNPTSPSFCIYTIPYCLWRAHEKAYRHRVVALGPLDHHDDTIQAVEEQKWRYLQEVLSGRDGGLERFLKEMKALEKSARRYYSESLEDMKRKQFLKIMLLDGCFIIQLLLKETRRAPISPDDPIFRQRGLFHEIKRDLLLLENQIPFFLLDRLFHLISSSQGICVSFLTIVQEFFEDRMREGNFGADNPLHFLHLVHSNLFPHMDGQRLKASVTDLKPFPGAVQLLAAGVEFRSCSPKRLGIKFEDGVVEIPHLSIEEDTKSLFLNLVAFEKLYPHSRPHVAVYIFFMRCLINTAEDVEVLCSKGIIVNCLGSDQEAADLFRELRREIAVYPNEVFLADTIERIRRYSSVQRNVWGSRLRHSYSNQPWTILLLMAAIILLVLMFLQALYGMVSYFHPHPS